MQINILEPENISDKNIVVVGGGDSAMEAAMLLKDTNRVKLLCRSDNFTRSKPKNREKINEISALVGGKATPRAMLWA